MTVEPATSPSSDDRPWDLRLRDALVEAAEARHERRRCTIRRAVAARQQR